MTRPSIVAANEEAFRRIVEAEPVLVGVRPAHELLPGLTPATVLHAGPPLRWAEMCGPLQAAVIGALRFEGLARSEGEAVSLVDGGRIRFAPCHDHGAVGPMTGIITRAMPLLVVENRRFGNRATCPLNEGLGKVLRFGANDESVLARLHWLADLFAPALGRAVAASGGIDLRVLMAQALGMGDEMHQRNVAATSLFARAILPHLVRADLDRASLAAVTEFLVGNDQFFLNLAMAAAKATLDPARGIPGSTLVTAMARNGTQFGIRVSAFGDRWFTAPANTPVGLYFPGYGPADANPDMGDSAIVETMGLGGFCMAASPAVARFVGAGSPADARRLTQEMREITLGPSPHYLVPALDEPGAPTGIDVRRVVETGVLPVINTGIAHRKAGVGQIGAGVVRAPMGCFEQALEALAAARGK
jgi:hypothetical protein